MAKNIVLLSDGTGNSAAKLLKTNVWRVYESLDLTDPDAQVACYDDGVGTSSFTPLALLGGALGVGLRRNVLRLYRFLCEHYDPGDRIYLFGFSRGAFTVRVLLGLICDQGIIRTRPTLAVAGASGEPLNLSSLPGRVPRDGVATVDFKGVVYGTELSRLSNWAYREYRKKFDHTKGLVGPARTARDVIFRVPEKLGGLGAYDQSKNHQPNTIAIDFVGVWDTVDAYGMPVDELADGIDEWVWPLTMRDLELPKQVKRACHVLALDDERNTFHPVLWDESKETASTTSTHLSDERLSQVWFAGMHANVGGGYADDALAYVSLKWMTDQATDNTRHVPLRFVPALLEHHTKKADIFGRLYDSRQGLKGYYRYNPRRIQWLTDGQKHEFGLANPEVHVPRPKIHESVFERIAAAPEAYAPIVLPERYAVVMENGRVVEGPDNPYEREPDAAKLRCETQEAVWDLVWQKRVAYFATVAVSLYLATRPFANPVEDLSRIERGLIARLVGFAAAFVPAFLSPWIAYFQAHPYEFAICVALIVFLMWRGEKLQARICDTMRSIWLKVVPPAAEEWKTLKPKQGFLTRLRQHAWYKLAFAVLRRRLLPHAFGLVTLVWLIAGAHRATFEAFNASGLYCRPSAPTQARDIGAIGTQMQAGFESREFCATTGIRLRAGDRYRIQFNNPPAGTWSDSTIPVDGPEGFTSASSGLSLAQRAIFFTFSPFRRVWTADWFVPVARIGNTGMAQHPIDRNDGVEIKAEKSGELFLFVNDAIFPANLLDRSFGWKAFYSNNHGTGTVTVTRLTDDHVTDHAHNGRDGGVSDNGR